MKREAVLNTLEQYLDGKLAPGERADMEDRLASDPSLAEDLKLLRELREMTAAAAAGQQLKSKLKAAAKPHFFSENKPVKKLRFDWRWMAVAASMFLILLAGGYFVATRPSADERLLSNYFHPPTGFETFRSGGATVINSIEEQVDSLYQLGRYGQALSLMETVKPSPNDLPNSGFFYQQGILYLLNEQPERAIEVFNKIQNGFANDKNWYLAWAYFKKGDRLAAKAAFENIARSEGPYRSLAAEVVSKLD